MKYNVIRYEFANKNINSGTLKAGIVGIKYYYEHFIEYDNRVRALMKFLHK